MHTKNIVTKGKPLKEAEKVLIMVHGRGAAAADILSLSDELEVKGYALLAPQAVNHTWYPYSFLMPPVQNEPWLSSGLSVLRILVNEVTALGIPTDKICLLGFSQGACLTLEFAARNAVRFGGIVAFTGGLVGDHIYPNSYNGDFMKTPVLITTGDPDPHVPVARVHATAELLRAMNADVTEKVYPGKGHTISPDETGLANVLIFNHTAQE